MSDSLISYFDADRNAVILRLASGREVGVLDPEEAQSLGHEILAASRGESTGYEEFLAQESGTDPARADGDPGTPGS